MSRWRIYRAFRNMAWTRLKLLFRIALTSKTNSLINHREMLLRMWDIKFPLLKCWGQWNFAVTNCSYILTPNWRLIVVSLYVMLSIYFGEAATNTNTEFNFKIFMNLIVWQVIDKSDWSCKLFLLQVVVPLVKHSLQHHFTSSYRKLSNH